MTHGVMLAKARVKAVLKSWHEVRPGVNDPAFVPDRLDRIVATAERTIDTISQDVVTEVRALLTELSQISFPIDPDDGLSAIEDRTFSLKGALNELADRASQAGFAEGSDDLQLPVGVRVPAGEVAERLRAFVASVESIRPVLERIEQAQAADEQSGERQAALVQDLIGKAEVKIEIIGLKVGDVGLIDVSGIAAMAQQLRLLLQSFSAVAREASGRVSRWLSEDAAGWVMPGVVALGTGTARLVRAAATWIERKISQRESAYPKDDPASLLPDPRAAHDDPPDILHGFVGMEQVRAELRELRNLLALEQEQRRRGLPVVSVGLHVALHGRPGTGKTEVAKAIAQIYRELGVLQGPFVACAGRADLIAGYVGQTAIKTRAKLDEARGGVLFIDEAYTLAGKHETDFGKEAIDEMLRFMTEDKDKLAIIVAGYPEPMREFLRSSAGLSRRFTRHINMPEYTDDQLVEILIVQARRSGKVVADNAKPVIREKLAALRKDCTAAHLDFGFAGDAHNLMEKARLAQAQRFQGRPFHTISDEEFSLLTVEDFQAAQLHLP